MEKIKVTIGVYQNSTSSMNVVMSTAKGSIGVRVMEETETSKAEALKMKLSLQDAKRLRDGLSIVIKNFEEA
jgi:predicted LPLAT superfamily acyltransferase